LSVEIQLLAKGVRSRLSNRRRVRVADMRPDLIERQIIKIETYKIKIALQLKRH